METQKITLKLSTQERGVKRLLAAPSSAADLLSVVRDHTRLPNVNMKELQITYTDNSGDKVAVSGDDDLLAAYQWAATQPTATIKMSVAHINDELVDKLDSLQITQPEEMDSEGTM
jgi:hypothetical protein